MAAKRRRNRRVHARYDRIFRPDILWRAWPEVRVNGGAAGVDGVTLEAVERHGAEQCLAHIRQDLRAGPYRPPPVRRVHLPKPDGGQRPIGSPTVRDRVVQPACKRVIEPIVEANCQATSYGCRPKRRAHQAVKAVKHALIQGWWGVDADLHHDFDTIDHPLLLSLVARRVSDRRVLKLIRQWLQAGVLEQGQWQPTEVGSPQGGVVSPVVANLYLHVLDRYWVTRDVVKRVLEPEVDKHFHPASYGYRPGKSALEAVGQARERCWRYDWVLDLDIQGFFDTIDHARLRRAVKKHTDSPMGGVVHRAVAESPRADA